MRKLTYFLLLLLTVVTSVACSDDETYADQKKKEKKAIEAFIAEKKINTISEETFHAQGNVTDTMKNEYVLFSATGVYMQIVRKGCGEPIKSGESTTVLCRYTETNLLTDSIQASNVLSPTYALFADKMSVSDDSGTFTAYFVANTSSLMSIYSLSSTMVPQGWLVPLTYINIGRPADPADEVAKVRIIVPHNVGHSYATQAVMPCFYEITYQRGR